MLYLQRCTKLCVKPNSAIESLLIEATTPITTFDLSNNYVGPRGLLALLDVIADNPNVKRIIMGNNGANNDVVERVCSLMRTHPSLQSVDLNNNPVSHLAGRMLLHAIQTNSRIVGLSLQGTVLQPAIMTRIALQLHRNQKRMTALEAKESKEAEEAEARINNSNKEKAATAVVAAAS